MVHKGRASSDNHLNRLGVTLDLFPSGSSGIIAGFLTQHPWLRECDCHMRAGYDDWLADDMSLSFLTSFAWKCFGDESYNNTWSEEQSAFRGSKLRTPVSLKVTCVSYKYSTIRHLFAGNNNTVIEPLDIIATRAGYRAKELRTSKLLKNSIHKKLFHFHSTK